MDKLEFTLKQHTPIIHFQHDQDGATLRATEVKPKLDRFIIKQMGGKDKVPKEWFNNEEKGSLDYKMKIESSGEKSLFLPLARFLNQRKQSSLEAAIDFDFEFIMPSSYFGNEDKFKFYARSDEVDPSNFKLDELRFCVIDANISVTIFIYQNSLKDYLERNLNEFFLLHNFGTRQDKGFGSYTIEKCIRGEIVLNNTDNKLKKFFLKKRMLSANVTQSNIFSTINEDYQILKSGINLPAFGRNPSRYEKSELFKYFVEKNIRWEKRKIKQELNNAGVSLRRTYEPIDVEDTTNRDYNSYVDRQKNDYKYIRALLGLGENLEFITHNRGRIKIKITHLPVSGKEKIERFQSPIIFKVIENTLYIGVSHSVDEILAENFNFKAARVSLDLSTPNSFDLLNFLNSHLHHQWKNI